MGFKIVAVVATTSNPTCQSPSAAADGPTSAARRVFTRPGIGALAKIPSARTLPPGRSGLGGRVWGRCRPAHARQASGRDADEIEGDQQGVVEPGLDHATLAIPPAGGEEGGGQGAKLHAPTVAATDHP